MIKFLAGVGIGILFVAMHHPAIGARAAELQEKGSLTLALAIGAELLDEPKPTEAASTPKPEIQPVPETPAKPEPPTLPEPRQQPNWPQPKPIIFDSAV